VSYECEDPNRKATTVIAVQAESRGAAASVPKSVSAAKSYDRRDRADCGPDNLKALPPLYSTITFHISSSVMSIAENDCAVTFIAHRELLSTGGCGNIRTPRNHLP
jgi:hypothetical protein